MNQWFGQSSIQSPPSAPPAPPAPPAAPAAEQAADAITALYQEHALSLIRMAHIMLGNRAAAEDVVQDAFCGLYRHWGDLASKDRAIGYVRSSVLNGCRTVLRRIPARELTPDHHPISWSAEAVVLSAEERRDVVRALRLLPERQRNVLVLRYYLDLPDPQVAADLGLRESTIRRRALIALQHKLEERS